MKALNIECFWHHDAYKSAVAVAVGKRNPGEILVDLHADDRYLWVCQLVMEACELGEGSYCLDSVGDDAV